MTGMPAFTHSLGAGSVKHLHFAVVKYSSAMPSCDHDLHRGRLYGIHAVSRACLHQLFPSVSSNSSSHPNLLAEIAHIQPYHGAVIAIFVSISISIIASPYQSLSIISSPFLPKKTASATPPPSSSPTRTASRMPSARESSLRLLSQATAKASKLTQTPIQ